MVEQKYHDVLEFAQDVSKRLFVCGQFETISASPSRELLGLDLTNDFIYSPDEQ